jgi:hypothetical protein
VSQLCVGCHQLAQCDLVFLGRVGPLVHVLNWFVLQGWVSSGRLAKNLRVASPEELLDLRAEETVARELGLKW